MRYKLYYTFNDDNLTITDYDYSVEEDINDVTEYYLEKEFGKKTGLRTTREEKQLELDLYEKWVHNKLDMMDIYHNPDFVDWLTDKYKWDVEKEVYLKYFKEEEDLEEGQEQLRSYIEAISE